MAGKRLSRRGAPRTADRPPFTGRVTIFCIAVAMLAASCGGAGRSDEDATRAVESADAESTSVAASATAAPDPIATAPAAGRASVEGSGTEWATATSELLPGEPVEGPLPIDGPLAVIGVGADDVLNVRERPGADQDIIETLSPLAKGLAMTGRVRRLADRGAMWVEIDTGQTVGWVNGGFVGPLAGTYDITDEIEAAIGGLPHGSTVRGIGDEVVFIRVGGSDPKPDVIVVAGPTAEDPFELAYDLIGYGDDSVLGERLHLFIRETGDMSRRFELQAIEVTYICARGPGGGAGLCP